MEKINVKGIKWIREVELKEGKKVRRKSLYKKISRLDNFVKNEVKNSKRSGK